MPASEVERNGQEQKSCPPVDRIERQRLLVADDFGTFGVMLWIFNADESLFRSGWFVESLTTQSLVVFIIRTRRLPFFSSRPSRPLLVTTLAVVAVGTVIPYSPVAHLLGFRPLPLPFLAILAAMAVTYLTLAELAKTYFFRFERSRHPLDTGALPKTGAAAEQ